MLETELRRSLRYQSFTSLLLIRPHLPQTQRNGDAFRQMTSLVQDEIRETDMLGIYEEDITAVILLHSDKNVARKVGERLKSSISRYMDSDDKSARIWFSLSGACFPSDATDLARLNQKAFEMLERAEGVRENCLLISD